MQTVRAVGTRRVDFLGKIGFGLALQNFVGAGESLRCEDLVSLAVKAERLGFTSVWVWDHILLGSKNVFPVNESLTVLTAVAARTSTLRLGTSILILPIRNPVELAKRIATIDDLSNGRMTLGAASGWYEREFRACGVPFKDRGDLLERNIGIMRRLWSENGISGAYGKYDFDHVTMEPKPVQKPSIPIWLGGYTKRVHERLGRIGDGWVSYFYTPDGFRNAWGRIQENARQAGRDPSTLGNCDILPVRMDGDKERSDKILKAFVAKYCDMPPWSEATLDSSLMDSSEDCIAKVDDYSEAGVQNIVMVPCVAKLSEIDEQVEKFARTIIDSF